jgi:hypothetical protein
MASRLTWGALVAIFGCLAVAALIFWLEQVEPRRRHQEWCQRVHGELRSLANKRPPELTREQWENVIAWTLNAHGNCLIPCWRIPSSERDRFEAELKRRLRERVDLQTIDWIWDEIVRMSPYGKTYSDDWRPTLPQRLKEFEEGKQTWGIEVD